MYPIFSKNIEPDSYGNKTLFIKNGNTSQDWDGPIRCHSE